MALTRSQYIVDNSAYNRVKVPAVRARLEPLAMGGLIATCGVIELEALVSARSPSDYVQQVQTRGAIFEYLDSEESDFELALDIQSKLAQASQHRAGKIPDMLMAAVAVRNNLTLLHYDSDFDLIGGVEPRFRHEWVVPRGSVD